MKRKILLIIVATTLSISMLTSCGASNESPNITSEAENIQYGSDIKEFPNSESSISKNSTNIESTSTNSLNNTTETAQEMLESNTNTAYKSDSNAITKTDENKLISITGVYIGKIDGNFIKINVHNKTDSYIINEDLLKYIESKLARGTTVDFTYFINNKNEKQLTKIEKKYYDYINSSGVYVGETDNNTIEIIDDKTGKYNTYRLTEQTKSIISKLQGNQNIQFVYYKNRDSQLIISDIYGYTVGNTLVDSIGIYSGRIDSNSIEIKDSSTGKPEAYRLTENMKEHVKNINDNTKVNFTYYINENNQKVIKAME